MGDSIHEIRKTGNLYFLLNGLIGALNKIGDALIRLADRGTGGEQLSRIEKKLDQILDAVETDPAALKALAARIRNTSDALESAVKNQQPNTAKEN